VQQNALLTVIFALKLTMSSWSSMFRRGKKSDGGLIFCDPEVEDDTTENLVLGTFFT